MRTYAGALIGVVALIAGCGGGGGGGGSDGPQSPSADLRSGPLMFSNVAFTPRHSLNLLGDFDEDGLDDMLMFPGTNGSMRTSGIHLRRGSPTELFDEPEVIDDTQTGEGAAIADFNGDNHLDIALGGPALVLFPGQGNGTFGVEQAIDPLSGSPDLFAVAAVDFDGDSDADLIGLIEATAGIAQIAVYLNNGTGTFTRIVTPVTNGQTLAGGPVDFNGDGELDIACVYGESPSQSVAVYFGVGDGTFASPVVVRTGVYWAFAGAVGDLNGDSAADVVIAELTDVARLHITAVLGNGSGTFTTLPTKITDVGPALFTATFQLVELTGDGMLDFFASVGISGHFLFEGMGDGTFGDATFVTATSAINAIVHDFSGDSVPDIYAGVLIPGNIGGFNPLPTFSAGGSRALASLDLNSDGYDDIVSLNETIRTFTSDGAGTFTLTGNDQGPVASFGETRVRSYPADFNGDSLLDVAVIFGDIHLPTAAVFLNQGDGTVALGGTVDLIQADEWHLTEMAAPVDLDNDGNFDLFGSVITSSGNLLFDSGAAWVAFGNGDGTFQPPVYPFSGIAKAPEAADLDGDGLLSLVFLDVDAESVRILHTQSNRTFTAGSVLAGFDRESGHPVAVGRLDTDALDDLVVMSPSAFTIYYGNSLNGVDTGQTFAITGANTATVGIVSSGIASVRIVYSYRLGGSSPDAYSRGLRILERTGARTFALNSEMLANGAFDGEHPTQIIDLNADGNEDLVTAWSDAIEIIRGRSDGGFNPPLYFDLTPEPSNDVMTLGDWNGDGDQDIAAQSSNDIVIANNQMFQ